MTDQSEVDWDLARGLALQYGYELVLASDAERVQIRHMLAVEDVPTLTRGAIVMELEKNLLSTIDALLATHPERDSFLQSTRDLLELARL